MTDKILLIKAKGGLGNRMLSAVCGLVFAELTGRRPVIDWRDGSYAPLGQNAYSMLFDVKSMPKAEAWDDVLAPVSPPIWTGLLGETPEAMLGRFAPDRHSSMRVYRQFCTDLSRLDAPEDIAVFWGYLPKFGRLAQHLRHDPRFSGRSVDAIISDGLDRWFVPNHRIREAVAALEDSLPRPLIGVHIRYTDRKIPLHRVKAALRRRLSELPDASIFLATDNAAVQEEIRNEFPRVYNIEKHLNPDGFRLHWPAASFEKTREAENALIDMWMLGRCDHLIYSRHSTFSVTSAHLGRIPADRQDDVDRWNLPVVAKRLLQSYI